MLNWSGPRGSAQRSCDTEGQKPGRYPQRYLSFFMKKWGMKMNGTWLKVVLAAGFEVGWVIGLKHADSALEWTATVIAMVVSFYYLVTAGRTLPVGTVYAVFVGLGTAGTVLSEILFFGVPFQLSKVLWIGLLLVGIIGLKVVTADTAQEGRVQ